MAIRAAATRKATPPHQAAPCPRPATLPAAAVQAATPRPYAGLPPVPGLARPATDFSVTEPDAAQTLAPSALPVSSVRALRRGCCGELPASCAPIGAGPRSVVLVVSPDRAVGCSIAPVAVRAVDGSRGHGVPR